MGLGTIQKSVCDVMCVNFNKEWKTISHIRLLKFDAGLPLGAKNSIGWLLITESTTGCKFAFNCFYRTTTDEHAGQLLLVGPNALWFTQPKFGWATLQRPHALHNRGQCSCEIAVTTSLVKFVTAVGICEHREWGVIILIATNVVIIYKSL